MKTFDNPYKHFDWPSLAATNPCLHCIWQEGHNARDEDVAALEKRVHDLAYIAAKWAVDNGELKIQVAALQYQRDEARDAALVEAIKMQCDMCRLMEMPQPSNGGYYRHKNGRLCPVSGVHALRALPEREAGKDAEDEPATDS